VGARSFPVGDVVKKQEVILLFILIAYCAFVALVNPVFLSLDNIFDVVKSSAGMMILAMGILVVLISGGIDVSFTAIAIFSGYVTIRFMLAYKMDSLFLAFSMSAVIGLFMGFLNGVVIHRFRLQPLIATLGTQNIFIGFLEPHPFSPFPLLPEAPPILLHFSFLWPSPFLLPGSF